MRCAIWGALAAAVAVAAVPRAAPPEVALVHQIQTPAAVFLRHGPDAPVMVVAHRGDWRDAPENSLGAINQAVAGGADVVEIDVKRTGDGELVLMHDQTVNRTTNGTGRVDELTFAQVKALRLRSGPGGAAAAVTDATVPTLREAMQAVGGTGTVINLDKAWDHRDQVYDLLAELGQLEQGLFKSDADVAEVAAFLGRDPRIRYSHIVDDANADDIGAFPERQPHAYELLFDRPTDPQIQPDVVARARATSRIWINTLQRDEAFTWATAVDRHGADMIQTDDHSGLSAWLLARPGEEPEERRQRPSEAE